MPIKNTFNFADLTGKDRASRELVREFQKHKADVASIESDGKTARTSGVAYKTLFLAMADSQTVQLRIKQSGDVFQVLINNKIVPIKNQDDLSKAVIEIIDRLDAGRKAFQKAMTRVKAESPLPKGIKTAKPEMENALREKIVALNAEIEAVRAERVAAQEANVHAAIQRGKEEDRAEAAKTSTEKNQQRAWQQPENAVAASETLEPINQEPVKKQDADLVGFYDGKYGNDVSESNKDVSLDEKTKQRFLSIVYRPDLIKKNGDADMVNPSELITMYKDQKSERYSQDDIDFMIDAGLLTEFKHNLNSTAKKYKFTEAGMDAFYRLRSEIVKQKQGEKESAEGGIPETSPEQGKSRKELLAEKYKNLSIDELESAIEMAKSERSRLAKQAANQMRGAHRSTSGAVAENGVDMYNRKIEEYEDAIAERKDRVGNLGGQEPATIEISGNELGEFADTEEGKKALREAVKAHLVAMRGEWVECPALGGKVEIRRRGIDKALSASADVRKLKIMAEIKALIRSASLVGDKKPYDQSNDKSAVAYFTLMAGVSLNGESLHVMLVVKKDVNGAFHYDATVHYMDVALDGVQDKGRDDARPCLSLLPMAGEQNPSRFASDQLDHSVEHGLLSVNSDFDDIVLDRAESAVNGMVLNLFIEGEEMEDAQEDEQGVATEEQDVQDDEIAAQQAEESKTESNGVPDLPYTFAQATKSALSLFRIAAGDKAKRNAFVSAKAVEEALKPVAVHWDATDELPEEWSEETLDAVGLFGDETGGFIKGSIKDTKGAEIARVTIRGDGDVMFVANADHAEAGEFDPEEMEFGRWVSEASKNAGDMIDKIKASVDFGRDRAPIEAYKQAFEQGAAAIRFAIGLTESIRNASDDVDHAAEIARLHAASELARTEIENARKAAIDAGFDPYGEDMDSQNISEIDDYGDSVDELRKVIDELGAELKAKNTKLAKDDLKAIPDDAPMEAYAALVFRSHGIQVDDDNPMLADFIKAIRDRDANRIRRVLVTGVNNKASKEIFERATRMKLEKTQKARGEQIDTWAGITPEQRKAMSDEREEDRKIADSINAVNESWDGLKNLQAQGEDGLAVSVQQWIKDKYADGYSEVSAFKKGAVMSYGMAKTNGERVFIKTPRFTDFMKAAKAYGGLSKALAMVGALLNHDK